MNNMIFQKLLGKLSNLRNKLLDVISPFTSWLALVVYYKYWLLTSARRTVKNWDKTSRKGDVIKDYWYNIHQPENWAQAVMLSFVIIFFPQLLAYILFISPMYPQTKFYGWVDLNSMSTLGTMWQVTAGLIGITFVIVVFIVEFANREKYERRSLPVFLTETWMLFTASFGIFVIISMGITSRFLSSNLFRTDYLSFMVSSQWVLFIINTLLIMNIFIRTVRILPRSGFIAKVKKFNHKIATRYVELEVIDRVAFSKSFQTFKDLGIEFPYFEPDPDPGKESVSISKLPRHIQKVTDINIKLVEIAYQHAKILLPEIKSNDFIFYAKLDHRIAKEKPGIAMINPIINHPSVTSYLMRCIKFGNFSRAAKITLHEELILNRDMILRAVQNQEAETVEDLLNHYYDLIEAFLQKTESLGIHFTQESASKEMNLFSDWKLVSTIIEQYRSLITSFIVLNDFELVMLFLRFPINLMNLAMLYKDHLIYQQFASLYALIYFRCADIQNPAQRERTIDYFVQLLVEHRRFTLNPRLEKIIINEKLLSEYRDYYIDLLVTWNRLLKIALDANSLSRFGNFANEIKELVHGFYSDINEMDITLLDIKQDYVGDEGTKSILSKEIEINKLVLENKIALERLKQRMFLGFGGWIIHLLESGMITRDDYFNIVPSVHQFFMDFSQFYQDYSDDSWGEKEDQLFNWDSWEMSERESRFDEPSFSPLSYKSWIEIYFIIRSLELLPDQHDLMPSVHPSYRSKDIFVSIEKKVKELFNNNLWLEVMRKSGIERIEDRIKFFIEILQNASENQQQLEEDGIIKASLDDERITSFKLLVIKNWKETATIRQLVNKYGRYRELVDNDVIRINKPFEIRRLLPKEAFIKQNRVTYFGLGELYGRRLAEFEDRFLGSQFCIGESILTKLENINDDLIQQGNEMVEFGLRPIIFINGKEVTKRINSSDLFIPGWRVQSNPLGEVPFWGLINEWPILHNKGIPQESIFLVDINLIGILTQYKIIEEAPDPIMININVLSNEQAEKIIEINPDWTKDSLSGEAQEHGASIRHVLQNVSLRIEEYCRFEEISYKAVRSIMISIDKNEPTAPDEQDVDD